MTDNRRAAASRRTDGAIPCAADDVGVVHDLPPDIHRRAVPLQRPLHDVDRPADPGAERTRAGKENLTRTRRRRPLFQHRDSGPQTAQRGDATAEGTRPEQWVIGGVHNGSDDRERNTRPGQLARLHVHRERATAGQFEPIAAGDDPFGGHDRSPVDSQTEPAQRADQQGRRRHLNAGAWSADLVGDDHVPRPDLWRQPAADPGDHQRAVGQGGRGGRRTPESHPGAHHPHPAPRRAQGRLFDPHRRAQHGSGHEPLRTYRPSADNGKTVR
jgi:hypothetical protein